ncbi:MAG: cyanophycin synthetase [Lacunisphaera sp.]
MKRRQELLVDTPTLKVIEDFGHHPTALAETLQSLRSRHPGLVISAVFEPRSNTARTKVLQAGLPGRSAWRTRSISARSTAPTS